MKRSFSSGGSPLPLAVGGLGLVAATYGLVRLASGLLLPDVQRDLGLDLATAGAISAGASAMYCACALAAFLLAARRPRTLVAAAGLGGAAGALGMAAADGVPAFAVAAIVASSGAGLASPALVALLGRDRATSSRPQLQAIVNAGTGPGLALAAILALVLPDWRSVWVVAAIATAVAALSTLLASRVDHGDASDAPPDRRSELGAWLRAHARVLAAALLMGAGSAAVWSFGRSILVDAGAGDALSLVSWIGIGVGGALAVATAGALERIGARRAWALAATTIALTTGALALAAGSAPLAIGACAAFGWAYMAGTGALISWTRAIDPGRAASGTAMLFVVLVLGQAVGAAAVGAAAPFVGLAGAFVGAAGVALAAVATGGVRPDVAQAPAHVRSTPH